MIKLTQFFYKKDVFIQENRLIKFIIFLDKQKMEKDYICGCGKAYGSYPAFSTHRKVKHNNQNVEGTVIPSQ